VATTIVTAPRPLPAIPPLSGVKIRDMEPTSIAMETVLDVNSMIALLFLSSFTIAATAGAQPDPDPDGMNAAEAAAEAADAAADAASDAAEEYKRSLNNRWFEISADVNGTIWRAKYKDLNKPKGWHRVWVELDHSRDKTIKHRRSLQLIEFDCTSKRTRTLELIRYDAQGRVSESLTWPEFMANWSNVPPDTVIEGASDNVCSE